MSCMPRDGRWFLLLFPYFIRFFLPSSAIITWSRWYKKNNFAMLHQPSVTFCACFEFWRHKVYRTVYWLRNSEKVHYRWLRKTGFFLPSNPTGSLFTLKVTKCEIFDVGQICTILSLLAYAQCTLATIFPLRSTWRCQNSFFWLFTFLIG
jgi:hypothetical protein